MQKTCPRCGVTLCLEIESVQTTWIFSKCFQCKQTNLVRALERIELKSRAQAPMLPQPEVELSSSLIEQMNAAELSSTPRTQSTLNFLRTSSTSNAAIIGFSLIGIGAGIALAQKHFNHNGTLAAASASKDRLEIHAASEVRNLDRVSAQSKGAE
jgi:hypothetical protein